MSCLAEIRVVSWGCGSHLKLRVLFKLTDYCYCLVVVKLGSPLSCYLLIRDCFQFLQTAWSVYHVDVLLLLAQ